MARKVHGRRVRRDGAGGAGTAQTDGRKNGKLSRCVVDTNVAVVANGKVDGATGSRMPSVDCRAAAVQLLLELVQHGTILLDLDGAIQAEYASHLNARGQPGVGDRFYREVLNSAPRLVQRVHLPKGTDGEYLDLPKELVAAGFDRSDRKFAALARREGAPVVNAVDSDWLEHLATLNRNGISVRFLCGCNTVTWFEQ